MSTLPPLQPKATAAVIRTLLRTHFPATKFRVTTGRGSMVSAVDVRWTDGPTAARVDALVSCFKAGQFDGMTDSYEYDNDSALIIDGQTFRPGTRYVFTERTISTTLARKALAQVSAYYGEEAPAIVDKGTYWRLEQDTHCAAGREYWSTLLYRAASDHTRFARHV